MVKVALVKVPVGPVVAEPTLVSLSVMVTPEPPVKPVPLTATWSPTKPEVGVMVILSPMVKVAVATLPLASWALTV